MARFSFPNHDLSMAAIQEIPQNVVADMLDAGANVTVNAHRRSIETLKLVKSGQLRDSIVKLRKRDASGHIYVLVYPKGKRRPVDEQQKATATNNDVGFVHEFGAPEHGITAKQWMRSANEQSADEITEAEYKKYDEWLSSMGY